MSPSDRIHQLIARHQQGIYTPRELLPLLIREIPQDDLKNLRSVLPADISTALVKWARDYPLEGGIQIRDDGQTLPLEKIIWLKREVRDEG